MTAFSLDSLVEGVLGASDYESIDIKEDFNLAIFVDESTDPRLISLLKEALMPVDDHVKMHVEPFLNDLCEVDGRADLTIIVANESPWVGAIAAISASKDIPTVVLAESLVIAVENAELIQFPLNLSDVISRESICSSICPIMGASLSETLASFGAFLGQTIESTGKLIGNIPSAIRGESLEPVEFLTGSPLDDSPHCKKADFEDMVDSLAVWVMKNAPKIRDAFARSFPFAQKAKVDQIVRSTAYQNAVTAAMFFTPGSDFSVMAVNQVRMLIQVERQYGFGLEKSTIFEAATVVFVAFASRSFVRKICKHLPILSWLIKVMAGYLITLGMGMLMCKYCEFGRQLAFENPNLDAPTQ